MPVVSVGGAMRRRSYSVALAQTRYSAERLEQVVDKTGIHNFCVNHSATLQGKRQQRVAFARHVSSMNLSTPRSLASTKAILEMLFAGASSVPKILLSERSAALVG